MRFVQPASNYKKENDKKKGINNFEMGKTKNNQQQINAKNSCVIINIFFGQII